MDLFTDSKQIRRPTCIDQSAASQSGAQEDVEGPIVEVDLRHGRNAPSKVGTTSTVWPDNILPIIGIGAGVNDQNIEAGVKAQQTVRDN